MRSQFQSTYSLKFENDFEEKGLMMAVARHETNQKIRLHNWETRKGGEMEKTSKINEFFKPLYISGQGFWTIDWAFRKRILICLVTEKWSDGSKYLPNRFCSLHPFVLSPQKFRHREPRFFGRDPRLLRIRPRNSDGNTLRSESFLPFIGAFQDTVLVLMSLSDVGLSVGN